MHPTSGVGLLPLLGPLCSSRGRRGWEAQAVWKAGLFNGEAAGRNTLDVIFLSLICFGLPWVFVALCGLFLVVVSEGDSLVSVWRLLLLQSTALECGGFSVCGAQA